MAKNQSTYTLKIDAELSNLQKILNQAKNSLSSFMASGNAPKGLEKAFEKINDLLGQISDKTGKPLDLKGLAATGKDLTSVQESFKAIIRLLGEFDDLSEDIKLSFLSGDEQKKIQDASKALSDYGKAIEEVAKKQKLLDATQKTNTKDKSVLDKAKKKVGGLQDDRTLAQARLSGVQTKLNAAKGLENANPKDIAKYEAEVTKLTAELEILDKNLNEANVELNNAQTAYNTSALSIKKMEAEIKRASGASLKQLKEEAIALGISLDGLNGHNAAKQIEILTNRLEEFKQETMKGAKPAFDAIKQGCEKAEKAADGLQDELKEAVDATKQMDEAAAQRDALEAKIKSFLGLSGAAQVLRVALRDAMQTITELDAVMGQMAVVTDLTVGDYWDQLPEYSERASKLGVSITSAYEAATLYYQQGLKANEVTALSEQTLKMAAIAGLDAADATDRMTAALRGFNMELNEANAQNIADVYSELAAITAADVDEISTAMTKTASIASSAGMEFETTAAFLSQIIETTRESAETAGTAMKTVIARFQELKKSPSEIGEIEGEIVDANAIETALRSVGVSLRDSAGQFRELDDVFLELSSKWDTLDKNTQRYIATIAAGSRQQSRFIAMMSDYSRTQELVTAANTSAGASNKQFEKTMDTLRAKVEKLKNAWHEFTMGIMNSDLVKIGVDVLTKFLNIINKATSGLDGIGGSLTKIIGIVAIFNIGKALYEKISGPISGFFLKEMPKIAYESGFKVGTEWKKGVEVAMAGQTQTQPEETQQKKTFKQIVSEKTGIASFDTAQQKWKIGKDINQQQKKINQLQKKRSGLDGRTKEAKELNKQLEQEKKNLKVLTDYQEKLGKDGKTAWQNVTDGIQQAGRAVTGLGTGLSVFGGILSSLGLEEAGNWFATFGNYVMIAGTALSVLTPIFSLFSFTVQGESKKLVIAGIQTQLAWWWVFIIIGALIALIAIIALVVAAVKKAQANSPEGKLKAATEAAEKAAEAAEKAKEAYEGLASAFESLQDKYTGLEELTRGTREWNEAVLELNSSVMDLIKQYPELTEFITNSDGVLKIDFANPKVQDVLDKALEASVGAENVSTAADIAVLEAERNKERKDLNADFTYERYIKQGTGETDENGNPIYTYKYQSDDPDYADYKEMGTDVGLSKEQIDIFSKAVADGVLLDKDSEAYKGLDEALGITEERLLILEESINDSQDAIIEYGRSLQQKEQQEKLMYDTMATSVVNLVDTMGMSEERIKQMFNIADGDDYEQAYKEVFDKISGDKVDFLDSSRDETTFKELANNQLKGLMTEQDIKDAFTSAGYKDAKLNTDKGWVEYTDSEGKTQHITDEGEIERILASHYASTVVKKRAEYSDTYISSMSDQIKADADLGQGVADAFERALLGENGDALDAEDLEQLTKLTEDKLAEYFNALPQALKDVYGSVEGLKEELDTAVAEADFVRTAGFEGVNSGAAKALDKMRGVLNQDASGSFTTDFNKIMTSENISEEDKGYISQQIASLSSDPTNREAWEAVRERLAIYGESVVGFINEQQKAFNTKYSDTFLKNLGVSDQMIANYNNAEGAELDAFHSTFKKWKQDYDTVNSEAKKADHELMEQTIEAIIDSREKQIDAYEEAVNAEAEANSKLISKISNNVARLRELREKEETEKVISENLSKQAYLGMDTSGGNALELLRLQEESDQMAQDYEDQMVDQAISRLEEDNQKALEQREEQIQLMRDQLDIYANSEQILADARSMIDEATETLLGGGSLEGTALGDLLAPEQFKSELEEAEFWSKLYETINGRMQSDGGSGDGEGEGLPKEKTQEEKDAEARKTAVDKAIAASGDNSVLSTEDYKTYKEAYVNAKGTEEEFNTKMSGLGIGIGTRPVIEYTGKDLSGYWESESVFNSTDLQNGEKDEGVIKYDNTYYHLTADGKSIRKFANNTTANGDLEVVKEPGTNKAKLYINFGGTGYEIIDELDRKSLLSSLQLQPYKTGGLAPFTGPAWLDGTPSRPEYVLNADQTERFFSLVDVLESFNKNSSTPTKSGDNYFDINISVDKLENDYDVEKIADKIRQMIYEDATYRNVNSINHIR